MRLEGRPLRNGSLRKSFLAAILAVYAAVIVGSMLVFAWSAGSISERYAKRFCVSQGELEKEKIRSLLDREIALSLKLADDPTIKEWILHESDPQLKKNAFLQLEIYPWIRITASMSTTTRCSAKTASGSTFSCAQTTDPPSG
jgi:hypothetical protein